MPRTLVVYFSRSGTTALVAQHLARALSADLEPISEAASRSGLGGYLRSGFEATFGRAASISKAVHDPSTYDLVLVGTPIWNASLSSPARSYLCREQARLPAVAFFCTMGGRGASRVFAQMEVLARKQAVGRLALRQDEVEHDRVAGVIDAFVRTIEQARPSPRPSLDASVPVTVPPPERPAGNSPPAAVESR